jgi:hypothetical protein
MRAIINLLIAAMLVIGLIGCAAKTTDPMKVKCPACGHEFSAIGAKAAGP